MFSWSFEVTFRVCLEIKVWWVSILSRLIFFLFSYFKWLSVNYFILSNYDNYDWTDYTNSYTKKLWLLKFFWKKSHWCPHWGLTFWINTGLDISKPSSKCWYCHHNYKHLQIAENKLWIVSDNLNTFIFRGLIRSFEILSIWAGES